MRRRAALYILLGLVTALLVVGMATELQIGNSTDPNVWMRAHRHVPLLQMLDLSAAFLFVVIGTYGLTISRLQLQLRHQAEDFGDQMQSLLLRNDELAKVNEEYAEQIASLEAAPPESPALTMGDSSQRVVAALHWQVDAQARQLEAVHKTLEHQHDVLEELRQHVHSLDGQVAPSFTDKTLTPPRLQDAPPPSTIPEPERELEPASEAATPATAEALVSEPEEVDSEGDASEAVLIREPAGLAAGTGNDGSTLIGKILEFDVGAFISPEPPQPAPRPKSAFARAGRRERAPSYPVDDSFLAMAAGHLSSIPDSSANPSPEPESELVEISVGKSASTPPSSEPSLESRDDPLVRTEGALAFDMAESALSSLKSETQEALSSLRAQVEATIPQTPPVSAPTTEPDKPSPNSRRKPWHLRF